jgi:hypothetical protein
MRIELKQTMLKIKDNTGKIFILVVFANEYNQILIGGFENDSDRKEDK